MKSPAVSILLDSIDESLDDLTKPLHDWEFVELQIAETHGKLGTWIQWVLEKIDVLLPESVDCDNKLNYIQKYQMYTTLFYVTDAYVGAHIMAQHKLSEFFGQSRLGTSFNMASTMEKPENMIPSSPEEIAVCLESTLNVADAQRQLDGMNEVMIELIKTNVIADNLLDLEYNFVVKLIRQGVITTTDAEEIFHEIVRNHKAVATARRRQAITIAEAQIHADRGLAMDQILDKHSERSLKVSGVEGARVDETRSRIGGGPEVDRRWTGG